jgi:hypothetical protein
MTCTLLFTKYSGDLPRINRWAGRVERIGDRTVSCRVLVGRPEGKRPIGRSRCRWLDNTKMDLQYVACGSMDWIDLA